MAVFTEVSQATLEPWLAQFNVGELQALQGIAAGIENTNYFVTTTQGRFVLTIFEKLTPAQLPFYLGLMKHLAERGIPVPKPIAATTNPNALFQTFADKPASLVTCLPGRSVDAPSPAQCAQVGTWLAKMHLAGQDFALQQANLRGLAWWQETAPTVLPYVPPNVGEILMDEVAAQTAHAQSAAYQALPRGPVHADLFRDNALFAGEAGEQLGGFIDFYFAGTDTWLFDVAVTLNDWCIDHASGAILLPHAQAMLAAYHAVCPFTASEQAAWGMALRAAALRFWISRLYDYYLPRPAAMLTPKDPTHFERILQQRRGPLEISLPH